LCLYSLVDFGSQQFLFARIQKCRGGTHLLYLRERLLLCGDSDQFRLLFTVFSDFFGFIYRLNLMLLKGVLGCLPITENLESHGKSRVLEMGHVKSRKVTESHGFLLGKRKINQNCLNIDSIRVQTVFCFCKMNQ